MVISIKHELGSRFEDEEYCIDLNRSFGGYEAGDLIIRGTPFVPMPLELELAIRRDGCLIFRAWSWVEGTNPYFHVPGFSRDIHPTDAQRDTVAGLFSGRIKFDGLKLAIGGTLQDICPIDLATEEARIGKTIYLA